MAFLAALIPTLLGALPQIGQFVGGLIAGQSVPASSRGRARYRAPPRRRYSRRQKFAIGATVGGVLAAGAYAYTRYSSSVAPSIGIGISGSAPAGIGVGPSSPVE